MAKRDPLAKAAGVRVSTSPVDPIALRRWKKGALVKPDFTNVESGGGTGGFNNEPPITPGGGRGEQETP